MNADAVLARSAIESLRSGVPSRHAVAQLGTTQHEIRESFEASLESIDGGGRADPIVITANFGSGKSHLLEYLHTLAERREFVTSYVVVSPEMPMGNGQVVLKAMAENAQAPGRTGKALRALTTDFSPNSPQFARLRAWAAEGAGIDDSLRALLHLYEAFYTDPEFQSRILDDFEGKALLKTLIKHRLKEIGEAAAYDLSGPRAALLAHDRVRLLAQFYRACGCRGLVVLFDEIERIGSFRVNQRLAAYQEIGWWQQIAEQEGSAILPVFAMTSGFLQEFVTGGAHDEQRLQSTTLGVGQDERDRHALQGVELLKSYRFLDSPSAEQEAEVRYRIKEIYERAYGKVPNLPEERYDSLIPIRSKIRKWVTLWDFHRYYPEYAPLVEEEAMRFDTSEIGDEALAAEEETDSRE